MMEPWGFEAISHAVGLFESMICIYLMRTLLGTKYKWKLLFPLGAVLDFAINVAIGSQTQDMSVIFATSALFLYLFSLLFCRGSHYKKFFVVILCLVILAFSDVLSYALVYLFFEAHVSTQLTAESMDGLIGIALSKTLCFSIYAAIQRMARHRKGKLDLKSWIPLLVVPVVSTVTFMMVMEYILEVDSEKIHAPLVLVTTMGILFMNVLVFFIYARLQETAEAKQQLSLMRQQAAMQSKHYSEIESAHTSTQAIWHDMNNHMTVLSTFIQNNDMEHIRAYVEEIGKTIHELVLPSRTGNAVLDALLNEKYRMAEKMGIHMELTLQKLPEKVVSPMDLCIIIGNALDNAIEACQKVKTDAFIKIRIERLSDNLSIVVQNSAIGNPVRTREFKTTKKDAANHGFGLRNIKNALERNDGFFDLGMENGVFKFSAIVPW